MRTEESIQHSAVSSQSFGILPAASGRGRPSRAMRVVALLAAALREIFDESAYARFLARHQVAHSRKAYADFLRENELAKARRPRCC